MIRAILITLCVAAALAACTTTPPPLPLPPFLALNGNTPLPEQEDDVAFVEEAARRAGHDLTSSELDYNLMLFATRRMALVEGSGYSAVRPGGTGVWTINLREPADREALLAVAHPSIRHRFAFAPVHFDAAGIAEGQQRLIDALEGVEDVSQIYYDADTDRFVVGVQDDADVEAIRARIPADLRDWTRIEPGNIVILV